MSFVNPVLLDTARASLNRFIKQAFVPAGDPSMAGGGDPAAGGGGDPMAAAGGGDPAAAAGGGGGGGLDPTTLQPMIQQMVQQAMMQGGGAGGAGAGAGGALKPKIDVNVEMMQIKNILAKIADHLGIQIPAQDMVATPDKLMAMSQGQPTATPPGTGAPQGGGGAIGGMDPMQGMQPAGSPGGEKTGSARRTHANNGTPYAGAVASGFDGLGSRAAALINMRKAKR